MFSHRQKLIGILIAFCALGLLTACASLSSPIPASTPTATLTPEPPTATSIPMALTVNGEGIPITEFDAEVTRYTNAQAALGKTIDNATATSAVIEDYVSQLLLAQSARQNGFTLDEAALQTRIDALAAQVGEAEALTKWQSDHGYTVQDFRSAMK